MSAPRKPSWRKSLDLGRLTWTDRAIFLVLDKQFSREPSVVLARVFGALRRAAGVVRRG